MANKEADRKAEALKKKLELNAQYGKAITPGIAYDYAAMVIQDNFASMLQAMQPKDKGHLYVNGKHKLSTDMLKIHAVAETYMRQGYSVWISRNSIGL